VGKRSRACPASVRRAAPNAAQPGTIRRPRCAFELGLPAFARRRAR